MKKLNHYISFIVFLIISCQATIAQTNLPEGINRLIEKSLTELKGIPSISIAIVKNDTVFLLKSYGLSDIENQTKATINTPYYIASSTKSFTGTLAQILDDENIIDLDKPITRYKPIRNFKNKEIFKNVTIRDLLTHTSGITNGYLVWRNATSGEYTIEKLIEILETHTSHLNNNKTFKYDNLGYNIFDLILKEEFNLNWKDLLNNKLFLPLEMKHTTAYHSIAVKNKWGIAKPYIIIGDTNSPTKVNVGKEDKTMQAAGGLYTSVKDISNWLLFNINKGKCYDKIIYSEKTLEAIHQPQTKVSQKGTIFQEEGYGLGWHSAMFKNTKVLYHNGGFLGNSARIAFMPEEKVGVAVFVNESFYGDNIADLLIKYTFNYFLNKNDPLESYFEEITFIKEKVIRSNKKYSEILSERETRPTSLTLNIFEYMGNYVNEGFGSISLSIEQNNIMFQMGSLEAVVNYGIEENRLEVELLGPTSNSKIDFILEGNEVKYLKYKGLKFVKIK